MGIKWIPSCLTALLTVACAGPSAVVVLEEPEETIASTVEVPEPFDVSAYVDPPPEPYDLSHEIPEALLTGSGAFGATVSGFRIQVQSTDQKLLADRVAVEAAEFWVSLQDHAGGADALPPPPVYQDFRAPYYRVRVGNFLSRADAEVVLQELEKRFEQAFIVPAQVMTDRLR